MELPIIIAQVQKNTAELVGVLSIVSTTKGGDIVQKNAQREHAHLKLRSVLRIILE